MSKTTKKWLSLYVLISIMAFIILSMQYDTFSFTHFDKNMITIITSIFSSNWQTFFTTITNIGSFSTTLPLLFIISILLLIRRNYMLFLLFIFNFYSVRLANTFLKGYFKRNRPPVTHHLVDANYFSFPSGHSMNSIAFYGLLCWFLLQLPIVQKNSWKVILIFSFSCLILLIGVSRIYLRVHYPTDVIGGFLAGSAWFIGLILIYYFIHSFWKKRTE